MSSVPTNPSSGAVLGGTSPDRKAAQGAGRGDNLTWVRWVDVFLVIATFPFVLLADLPLVGYLAGASAWVLQRVIETVASARAARAREVREYVGIALGSMFVRTWLVGLSIVAAGVGSERQDGAMAAALVLAAFTVHFVISVFLRPQGNSQAS